MTAYFCGKFSISLCLAFSLIYIFHNVSGYHYQNRKEPYALEGDASSITLPSFTPQCYLLSEAPSSNLTQYGLSEDALKLSLQKIYDRCMEGQTTLYFSSDETFFSREVCPVNAPLAKMLNEAAFELFQKLRGTSKERRYEPRILEGIFLDFYALINSNPQTSMEEKDRKNLQQTSVTTFKQFIQHCGSYLMDEIQVIDFLLEEIVKNPELKGLSSSILLRPTASFTCVSKKFGMHTFLTDILAQYYNRLFQTVLPMGGLEAVSSFPCPSVEEKEYFSEEASIPPNAPLRRLQAGSNISHEDKALKFQIVLWLSVVLVGIIFLFMRTILKIPMINDPLLHTKLSGVNK